MSKNQQSLSVILALAGWFAIITQFVLMLNNRVAPVTETVIRFFSFFTILTNILTAFYFTSRSVMKKKFKTGTLTAITVYITIVGLVYQVLLRHVWDPKGLQKLVDELLHSVIPLLTICYWYSYEQKDKVSYSQITWWLIYPFVYVAYILTRGYLSGFYPYPFINADKLGILVVMVNAFFLLLLFVVILFLFVFAGKKLNKEPESV